MRGPPVVLTNTLGRPVTNVISERGAVPMVVVNTLGEPVTLVNSGGEPVTLFNPNGTLWDYPFSLFSNNEQGAWYDPSDFSTLYQNSTGTTPVTAVEQPVGLMLDRSRGLVLGSELVSNGDFSDGGTGWTQTNADGTHVATFTSGTFRYQSGTISPQFIVAQDGILTIGATYQIEISVTVATSGSLGVDSFGGAVSLSTTGVKRFIVKATSANLVFTRYTADVDITIDYVSVRELPGNHALQATSASRPVLRSRYNLLTRSEEFDNAAWVKDGGATVSANAALAPDGTTTADGNIAAVATGANAFRQNITISSATVYTFSVFLKYNSQFPWIEVTTVAGGAKRSWINVQTGAVGTVGHTSVTMTALAGGWYRAVVVYTSAGTGEQYYISGRPGNGNSDVISGDGVTPIWYAWGAQLQTAADQTSTGGAYQRIAAATDYDVSNPVWRPYLAFDGVDDSFGTSAIDFSGTDEVTVFAGVTKLSDAATGVVAELSANSQANNGSFDFMTAVSGADYRFRSVGTASAAALSAASYAAPITNVLTGIGDISGDVATLRVNGAQAATSATDQGTGNYGNYPLFIGRRNNASLPFNGRIYGLTVLGRTATANELSAMETWVNGKTGATLA